MMQYEIKYMDSSLADMVIIKEYLSNYYDSTWSNTAEEIMRHIAFLKEIPHAFPFYPESETYRKLVAGDYLVLYKVFEENHTVEVHAIWHGKMNILEHITKLPR
ncbi:MAG: type II toxin-antitoxin system RelE/ParE family toxin [Oscillospiraceae bacterium]|nr:type II toxin-antitoxin system RelE/ParE family toxin [Oscillospiraceae bacterium]